MVARLQVAGLSDAGRLRSLNEDRFYFKYVQSSDEEPVGLFIVSDGLGGYLAGDVASHWAIETVKREAADLFRPVDLSETRRVRPPDLWDADQEDSRSKTVHSTNTETFRLVNHIIKRANEVLLSYAQQKPREAGGMGATIVVCIIQDGLATIGSLGDSRAYLWRQNRLHQITTDHTIPGELAARGHLSPDKIPLHPQRHVLQRCLGRHVLAEPDIFRPIKLEANDRLLLCTDGLWNMVWPNRRLGEIVAQEPTAERLAHRLIEEANAAGGDDNITVLVIDVTVEPTRGQRDPH
jgi:serine/threonine protein phosphatase PrpC